MKTGRHHTQEAKEKNRQAHLGRKASQETKAILSELRKGSPNAGQFKKGHIPWIKGKKGIIPAWNKGKTGVYNKETLEK